ncbi:hypothetical protein [Vibrio cyclitrophicus]|uniref:hypothetical protein n=1 Tax=Vibrio cyclitrophicus TaxID=47951 RepID=UPI00036A3315|nr:hypothetical protein [Vibrio cyclitrophicus]OEE46695.1 hypothetical protein OAG_04390 [Vibrio cyclitrophicus FF75]
MITLFSFKLSFESKSTNYAQKVQLEKYYQVVKASMTEALQEYIKLQRFSYFYEKISCTIEQHDRKERASIRETKQSEKFTRLNNVLAATLVQYKRSYDMLETGLEKKLPERMHSKCIATLYYRELSKIFYLDMEELSSYERANCVVEDNVLVSVERDFQSFKRPNLIERILNLFI